MAPNNTSKSGFSRGRRWMGLLNSALAVAALLALVLMLNYLAAGHVHRFQWSRDAAFKLAGQTRTVLDNLTNDVQVTMFFQPDGDNQEIYGLTSSLLAEYQNANPSHVHVRLLDYSRFPGPAKELLDHLGLNGPKEKDFVVFESKGHSKIVAAREMADYDLKDLLEGSRFVRRSAFKGEMLFTSDIYAVSNPQTLKAYFLYGHGEKDPVSSESDKSNRTSCSTLASILKTEIDSDWDRLSLLGSNDVPRDCQLLIVAGPMGPLLPEEINKIAAYLKSGGRLLALLSKPCGLEPLLAQPWGVRVGQNHVFDKDPNYSKDLLFFTAQYIPHPIINPLANKKMPILMVSPHPLSTNQDRGKIPGAPEVSLLAATSAQGTDENNHTGIYFLLAAVEQGVIKGVDTPGGGGTRIVVAGDADFLDDQVINSWEGNYAFGKQALNWLLQRPQILLEGLGPQPIKEYKLYLTDTQSATIQWLFLAGMPAGILTLGVLVWLRRRH